MVFVFCWQLLETCLVMMEAVVVSCTFNIFCHWEIHPDISIKLVGFSTAHTFGITKLWDILRLWFMFNSSKAVRFFQVNYLQFLEQRTTELDARFRGIFT